MSSLNLPQVPKYRIILKAFDRSVLNIACYKICETVKNCDCRLVGPIKLPTKIKKFCVLRSPHVDKDSREHFQIKFYKRILDLYTNSAYTLDSLMRLSLPAGVSVSVKKK